MHAERNIDLAQVLIVVLESGAARCSACSEFLPLQSRLAARAINRWFCAECLDRARMNLNELELGGES